MHRLQLSRPSKTNPESELKEENRGRDSADAGRPARWPEAGGGGGHASALGGSPNQGARPRVPGAWVASRSRPDFLFAFSS